MSLGYNPDIDDLTQYGYLGGQALLGSADVSIEVSSNKQVSTSVNKGVPDTFSVPYFLSKFTEQVKVMLTPKRLFVPEFLPDFSPHYDATNHPVNQPALVFQSPLEYIGLPDEG